MKGGEKMENEKDKKKESLLENEMNQQGKTGYQLLGFAFALLGMYLILISFNLVPPSPTWKEFLLENPIFNNSLLFFLGGLGWTYLGYQIFRR